MSTVNITWYQFQNFIFCFPQREEIPSATPLTKRLQLSPHQPSPVPTPTPADRQPALLSLTIAGTPTPEETVAKTIFTSPAERSSTESCDLTRTPNMKDFKSPGVLPRTPGLRNVPNLECIAETEISVSEPEIIHEALHQHIQVKEAELVRIDAEIPDSTEMEVDDEVIVAGLVAEIKPENQSMEINASSNEDTDVKDMSVDDSDNKVNDSMKSLKDDTHNDEDAKENDSIEYSDKENICPPVIQETVSEVNEVFTPVSTDDKFFQEPVVYEDNTPKEATPVSGEENIVDTDKVDKFINSSNASNDLFESCNSEDEDEVEIKHEIEEVPLISEEPTTEHEVINTEDREMEEAKIICDVLTPAKEVVKGPVPDVEAIAVAPIVTQLVAEAAIRVTRSSRNRIVSESNQPDKSTKVETPKDAVPVRSTRSSKKKLEENKGQELHLDESQTKQVILVLLLNIHSKAFYILFL